MDLMIDYGVVKKEEWAQKERRKRRKFLAVANQRRYQGYRVTRYDYLIVSAIKVSNIQIVTLIRTPVCVSKIL